MVRLITHNMLTCHASEFILVSRIQGAKTLENCKKDNFPLAFSDVELVIRESEPNFDFLRRFLPKLEWNALVETAQSVRTRTAHG